MSKKHLDGQTIVITGAANGMGVVHAKMFAGLGANIVASDISPSVKKVVDDIVAAGGKAIASVHDVTDREQAKSIVRTAVDAFGRVDGVVLNAAINPPSAFSEVTFEAFDKTMKVNAYGIFNVAKAVWPEFVQQKRGRFVFIGAASFFVPAPNMVPYNVSKGAPIGLSNALAVEGAEFGITSNVIFPAAITEMSGAMMDEAMKKALAPKLRAEWVSPVVGWLLRRENAVTGKIIMASTSRAAEVFTGWNNGYESKDINIDELIENEEAVFDKEGFVHLKSIQQFMDWVLR
jgi:NAD(P)-dependent dehydrogenase (short-subunit alcohol dehydrogenase family)